MKKFNYIILSSLALLVLVSSPALLALEGQMATLINDVQELKRQVGTLNSSVEGLRREIQQVLGRQEGGAGAAAAPAAKKRHSQDELASHLYSKLRGGTQAEIDEAIAKLPALGFDINYSASGGRVADTPLYKAIGVGRADAATQDKLVAAGYRFNAAELTKFKGETGLAGIPFSKAVLDLLAADGDGAAATDK